MPHLFPGFSGLIPAAVVVLGIGAESYFIKEFGHTTWSEDGAPGTFEPFLEKYIRVSEFIVGLAMGSIVFLVGTSALQGQGGRLPWFYCSPLLLTEAVKSHAALRETQIEPRGGTSLHPSQID